MPPINLLEAQFLLFCLVFKRHIQEEEILKLKSNQGDALPFSHLHFLQF